MTFIPTLITAHFYRTHSYEDIWIWQSFLQQRLITARRKGELQRPSCLLLCEHNPVFTLGKSGKIEHLLLDQNGLDEHGIEFFKINRGGDITYHGPGQLTVYPILDMDQYYHDLHRYVRNLEDVVIKTLAEWGINGCRVKAYTGVWVGNDQDGYRKICAIGVHMSRWVSIHGLALNINTDLDKFQHIIPCGIVEESHTVTSMAKELHQEINFEEVAKVLEEKFSLVFGAILINGDLTFG